VFGTLIWKRLSGKQIESSVIKINASIYPGSTDEFKSDEDRYNWQMDWRANNLLIGDTDAVLTIRINGHSKPVLESDFTWINRGELIAGSFMSRLIVCQEIPYGDVDIYFKSKDDADKFRWANPKLRLTHQGEVTTQLMDDKIVINLVHGVNYSSPEDLISRFDIRACSIALDPNTNITYSVKGAAGDCSMKRIVFNPNPHNTTIARLVKYVERGFSIDPYQRLFFAELIRSDLFNPKLEISTGYRAVKK
jgi:hypothetical protein